MFALELAAVRSLAASRSLAYASGLDVISVLFHSKTATMDLTILTHAIPLTAIICLVYTASRFELPERILRSAAVMFGKTIGFLGAMYLLLLYLSR